MKKDKNLEQNLDNRNKKLHISDISCSYIDIMGEVSSEPQIISQLRDIVKNKQHQSLKDPKSGKKMKVDLYSANIITQVYDAIKSQSTKEKFLSGGLLGMQSMAFKVVNKK